MDVRPLDKKLSVSSQITTDDVEALKAQGFRAIISNRPDGEEAAQSTAYDIEAAAKRAGLAFHHIPVVGGAIGEDALSGADGPVLAFCRTGTRAASLWALSHAGMTPAATLLDHAKAAGHDLSGLRGRLDGAA